VAFIRSISSKDLAGPNAAGWVGMTRKTHRD
jgi:hypothetical protein